MEQDFILNLSQLIDKTIFNKSAICNKLSNYKCKNDTEEKIFKHIKENDKKQWKNAEINQNQNLVDDY